MATTITAATLKVTIKEEILLNNIDQGNENILSISSINEISACLVGSEMCIRDRDTTEFEGAKGRRSTLTSATPIIDGGTTTVTPVSYTHLTLPTILRV